jgi:hypothetical protein
MKTTIVPNRKFEEFLQELILDIDRPEAIDLLLEILAELRKRSFGAKQTPQCRNTPRTASPDRYDIFRIYPDRVVRIGFVRGAENAKRVLPGLHALGGNLYFLHQSGAAWRLVSHTRVGS